MFSKLYLGTNDPAEIFPEENKKHMSQLDERTKRGFLATKALPLGRHGFSLVPKANRVNMDPIYRCIHELKSDEQLPKGCVRKGGGDHKSCLGKEPASPEVSANFIKPHTTGLPQEDSVRWVSTPYEAGQDHPNEHTRHIQSSVILHLQSYRTPPIHTNHPLMERSVTALIGNGTAAG